MRKVIDYTGKYAKDNGEHVVFANVKYFNKADLVGFDAVFIDDTSLVEKLGIEIIKKKTTRKAKK